MASWVVQALDISGTRTSQSTWASTWGWASTNVEHEVLAQLMRTHRRRIMYNEFPPTRDPPPWIPRNGPIERYCFRRHATRLRGHRVTAPGSVLLSADTRPTSVDTAQRPSEHTLSAGMRPTFCGHRVSAPRLLAYAMRFAGHASAVAWSTNRPKSRRQTLHLWTLRTARDQQICRERKRVRHLPAVMIPPAACQWYLIHLNFSRSLRAISFTSIPLVTPPFAFSADTRQARQDEGFRIARTTLASFCSSTDYRRVI